MAPDEIMRWLRETDARRLETLWLAADAARRANVGDAVHLRGLVEISNHCVRLCGYCGLRRENRDLERYRMTDEEILACAAKAVEIGCGTLVLQSGEDPAIERGWMGDLIGQIKLRTPLAVTLSLGERTDAELAHWRAAGADRYLLRFETSNPELFARIHPPRDGERPAAGHPRITILRRLRELGYAAGGGMMVGIPGQTYADLARDIALLTELDLDMIGIGPFIPRPGTPLGAAAREPWDQAPATELMTCKVLAMARLACPRANIPSTTALAVLGGAVGRELGLARGANVVMPNLTPPAYRALYGIYPGKASECENDDDCYRRLKGRILNVGRTIGTGHGSAASPHGPSGDTPPAARPDAAIEAAAK